MPSARGGSGGAGGDEADATAEGAAGEPVDFAALGPGVWVELSVAADIEAVEAVSEILTRFAPGGTSVEPGFGLTNEGLGAVVDPSKPAIVRAYLPGLDPAGVRQAIEEATTALGHLQAFGLRPIGELTTRMVREADWPRRGRATSGAAVGRRLVIRPTWRRHRRQPGDVSCRSTRHGVRTGLHPTPTVPRGARDPRRRGPPGKRRRPRPRRRLRLRDPRDRRRPSSGRATCWASTPIRSAVESTSPTRASTADPPHPCPSGQRPDRGAPVRPGPRQPHRLAPGPAGAGLAQRARAGRSHPGLGIFRDREATSWGAFRAAGLEIGRRWAEEDWVALEAMEPVD